MGSQTSKATSDITQIMASSIMSDCTSDASGSQYVDCNITLGPGCNNTTIDCDNNLTATYRCSQSTTENMAQNALASASASTQAAALSAWNAQHTDSTATTMSELGSSIASFCFSTDGINQTANATIKCYGHNDVIDVVNNANIQTQCVLNTVADLVQTAEANATSKDTKTGLMIFFIVLAVLIVLGIVLYFVLRKKKTGGGGGGSGGKSGGVEAAPVAAAPVVAAPVAAAPAAAPVTAPVAAAPAAAPVAAAPTAAGPGTAAGGGRRWNARGW
jgi:hypothetical protein